MATKTLTITENAYGLLKSRKIDGESFSEEIVRLFSRKSDREPLDFFGIIPKHLGADLIRDLVVVKKQSNSLERERFKQLWK
tara:strand:- start:844 stop:1089 length:246 start_codon:yes stop_codon:yes gene_type:complete